MPSAPAHITLTNLSDNDSNRTTNLMATSAPRTTSTSAPTPQVVTGVQLMQGIGHAPAMGFWADAWSQVVRRPGAVAGLLWLGVVAFFAVFAPVLASGHPWLLTTLDAQGQATGWSSPLLRFLTSLDAALLLGAGVGVPLALWLPFSTRAKRFQWWAGAFGSMVLCVVLASFVQTSMTGREPGALLMLLRQSAAPALFTGILSAVIVLVLALLAPVSSSIRARALGAGVGVALGAVLVVATWDRPSIEKFEYRQQVVQGRAQATFTIIPWSPSERLSENNRRAPGESRLVSVIASATSHLPNAGVLSRDQVLSVEPRLSVLDSYASPSERARITSALRAAGELSPGPTRAQLRTLLDEPVADRYLLGTDANGSDMLSQLLHACRLSISIGLVSTSIALVIGVTLGALMGYFGGWVDLVLYRVVEVFMAVPVLFLLIVAANVIPPELRTTYVMMAIIGCFTWTGMARFTRAEFLKLRNQDFVQAAKSAGLPLRSVLFKHMLPNGVAPVLVDTSFAIAAAISVEAVLSYLGLGPVDQASWGKLLASAVSAEGEFKWWLAVFPGVVIFLTVLSYNLIGEALRDAIDPKLKKARV